MRCAMQPGKEGGGRKEVMTEDKQADWGELNSEQTRVNVAAYAKRLYVQ